jgi:hypothetical protein
MLVKFNLERITVVLDKPAQRLTVLFDGATTPNACPPCFGA